MFEYSPCDTGLIARRTWRRGVAYHAKGLPVWAVAHANPGPMFRFLPAYGPPLPIDWHIDREISSAIGDAYDAVEKGHGF
jgi:hypothetical protein